MKELFFIDCVFKPSQVHTTEFMLADMQTVAKATRGSFVIGGLITSISHALGLLFTCEFGKQNKYLLILKGSNSTLFECIFNNVLSSLPTSSSSLPLYCAMSFSKIFPQNLIITLGL